MPWTEHISPVFAVLEQATATSENANPRLPIRRVSGLNMVEMPWVERATTAPKSSVHGPWPQIAGVGPRACPPSGGVRHHTKRTGPSTRRAVPNGPNLHAKAARAMSPRRYESANRATASRSWRAVDTVAHWRRNAPRMRGRTNGMWSAMEYFLGRFLSTVGRRRHAAICQYPDISGVSPTHDATTRSRAKRFALNGHYRRRTRYRTEV